MHNVKKFLIEEFHSGDPSILRFIGIFSEISEFILTNSKLENRNNNCNELISSFSIFLKSLTSLSRKDIIQQTVYVHEFIENLSLSFPLFNDKYYADLLREELNNSHLPEENYLSKKIHFIWIGELNGYHLDYIQCWALTNPDYNIVIWEDLHFNYHEKNASSKHQKPFDVLRGGDTSLYIDRLFVSYSECAEVLTNGGITRNKLEAISNVQFRDINELFNKKNGDDINTVKQIYIFEVFCRKNLASASDILRILILNCFGGIYIDVDTLPDFIHYSPSLNLELLKVANISSNTEKETFSIGLTHDALISFQTVGLFNNSNFDDVFFHHYHDLVSSYKSRVTSGVLCIPCFKPLGELSLGPGGFLISKGKGGFNVFYSNVIASEKDSIFTQNAINNLITNYNEIGLISLIQFGYLNTELTKKFNEYFFDGIKNESMWTLHLSGPGLIVSSALNTIKQLLDLPDDVNKSSLLYVIDLFYGFNKYNMESALSYNSTWMKFKQAT